MQLSVDSSRCVACLACVRVCPTDAIALPPEAHPPLRPGAKVPATSSCSGFTLPTVALGRAHPSGQPGEPVATPQEERAA